MNLATGRAGGGTGRQPGSTFKAFALAEAIREGYSVDSIFKSPSEITFEDADNDGSDWTVKGGCCGGRTTLVEATEKSVNTVYAQLMVKLGAEKVVGMAKELGVSADIEPHNSAVLGTGDVSVLDMAAAYSTFANQGVRVTPRMVVRVERADGTVVDDFAPDRAQVLTADQAAKVNYCLGRVVESGTGEAAKFGRPQAGKTGTTQNNADAWFVGYTPKLTAAVWMGRPNGNQPMGDVHGIEAVQGGTLPALMWKAFMERAVADIDTGCVPSADHRRRVGHGPEPGAAHHAAAADHRTARDRAREDDDDREEEGRLDDGRPEEGRRGRRLARVDGLVGVVGPAGEAPPLDLVDHLHAARRCPTARA